MNAEQKAALIDRLSRALYAAESGMTHRSYPSSLRDGDVVDVYRIALASLTAPPVPVMKPVEGE